MENIELGGSTSHRAELVCHIGFRRLLFVCMILLGFLRGHASETPPQSGTGIPISLLMCSNPKVWVCQLGDSVGPKGTVEVEVHPELLKICPQAQVHACLNQGGGTLTIQLSGTSGWQPGALEELAAIKVYDEYVSLKSEFRLRDGGGAVIIVLIDD